MNIRYAATFALVVLAGCGTGMSASHPTGWQMMLPPSSGDSAHRTLDPNAPLSSWRPFAQGPYPSDEFCERAIRVELEADRREASPATSHFGFEMAQCIATDDPRLNSN
jgi:hypothetical protein